MEIGFSHEQCEGRRQKAEGKRQKADSSLSEFLGQSFSVRASRSELLGASLILEPGNRERRVLGVSCRWPLDEAGKVDGGWQIDSLDNAREAGGRSCAASGRRGPLPGQCQARVQGRTATVQAIAGTVHPTLPFVMTTTTTTVTSVTTVNYYSSDSYSHLAHLTLPGKRLIT